MNSTIVNVRGYTSHNTPAWKPIRILSIVLDTCFILLILLILIGNFNIAPIPRLSLMILFLALGLLYWIPQKKFFGVTLGERAWLLRPKKRPPFTLQEKLYQRDFTAPITVFTTGLATTLSVLITASSFHRIVLSHPDWLKATHWALPAFVPNPVDWTVSPFFYFLGGWPKSFQGNPVYYTLPYEVGPPSRFIGHIVAHWEHPDITVVFEGPKTPGLNVSNRQQIRECFLRSTLSLSALFRSDLVSPFNCFSVREAILNRHMKEIRESWDFRKESHLLQWSIKWFNVENDRLTTEEAPQGIYLSASGKIRIQDRFIFINGNGTHQSISLRRPKNENGTVAIQLLTKAIGSIHNFNELDSGKAWVDRALENIQLVDLQRPLNSSNPVARLSEIQQLLISRITVDPSDFNAYFHLAGTSVLLAKAATGNRIRIKAALDNLESSHHYAIDVGPKDVRLVQLRNLELEMGKLLNNQKINQK